jgi:hypothetical protein
LTPYLWDILSALFPISVFSNSNPFDLIVESQLSFPMSSETETTVVPELEKDDSLTVSSSSSSASSSSSSATSSQAATSSSSSSASSSAASSSSSETDQKAHTGDETDAV